eukprot:4998542-Pyramimonas_sp.AAC.1
MFSGTIRSNLDVGGKYSDADLWAVLKMVDLQGTVQEAEGGLGLDTVVREKGDNFRCAGLGGVAKTTGHFELISRQVDA